MRSLSIGSFPALLAFRSVGRSYADKAAILAGGGAWCFTSARRTYVDAERSTGLSSDAVSREFDRRLLLPNPLPPIRQRLSMRLTSPLGEWYRCSLFAGGSHL